MGSAAAPGLRGAPRHAVRQQDDERCPGLCGRHGPRPSQPCGASRPVRRCRSLPRSTQETPVLAALAATRARPVSASRPLSTSWLPTPPPAVPQKPPSIAPSPRCRTPSITRSLGGRAAPRTELPFTQPARLPRFARLGRPSACAADTSQFAEESTPRTVQHWGLLSATQRLRKGRKGRGHALHLAEQGDTPRPLQRDLRHPRPQPCRPGLVPQEEVSPPTARCTCPGAGPDAVSARTTP